MSIIKTIQKTLNCVDAEGYPRKWIVKHDSKGKIREVKLLHQSNQYTGKRKILNDEEVLNELIEGRESTTLDKNQYKNTIAGALSNDRIYDKA